MVITDHFVYLHKPKTGGTFVTDALLQLYSGKWNILVHGRLALLKYVRFKNNLGTLTLTANKHGGCLDIPKDHQHKTILTTIRNPYDYYVSQYEFGWWKRKEWIKYYRNHPNFDDRFSGFPNISFPQFMQLLPAVFNEEPHTDFSDATALGRYTVEFIKSHFHHPENVLAKINQAYVQEGKYKDDIFQTNFIFTHRLNQQLHDFLLTQGYPKEAIAFIIKKEKTLPQGKGRTKDQKWEKYYTPEMKSLVRKKDWFLFEMFPEFEC